MKNKFLQKAILILIFSFWVYNSYSQITLDQKYYIHHKAFFLIEIAENDYKYEVTDSTGFSLYNLDHTPFLLNVVPPIPIGQAPNYYLISYVTSTLFDCDSSNIEYVISRADYLSNYYIYRSDGTLLFQQDSVTGYYAIAYAGSIYQNPIRNTPSGVKLFLSDNKSSGQDSLYIYSLCGELPSSLNENIYDNKVVSVFPNPSNGIIHFKINDQIEEKEFVLTIFNSFQQEIYSDRFGNKLYNLDINAKSLGSGIYYYALKSENGIIQNGKFIITK